MTTCMNKLTFQSRQAINEVGFSLNKLGSDNFYKFLRLLSGISASSEIYFWVAEAESSSGKQGM